MLFKVRNFLGILSNIFTLLSSVLSICFDPESEFKECSKELNFVTPNRDIGFAFGFGSINDTELMCKSRWHIKLLECMRKRAKKLCQNDQDKTLKSIWDFTLDSSKFKNGANYLCRPHNLGIFRTHKNQCFLQQEIPANHCAKLKSSTIEEAIKALGNESQNIHSDKDKYSKYVMETLNKYECKGLKKQLKCLYNILHINCHEDAVRLILNYFKEILPHKCVFEYETMLTNYINSDYYKNKENSRGDTETPSAVSIKSRQINNDNQEPENGYQKQSCIVNRVSVILQIFFTIFQHILFFQLF